MNKIFTCFIISSLFILSNASIAFGVGLIRDSETEDLLREITYPLIKAANLRNDDIEIYIVNDSSINAFVTGGQNIFINTGLIIKYADPNVLSGVIAHEVGHIAGGHLARGAEAMKEVNNIAILTYLAGIAAAITANSDAGYAILMGSSHVTQRLAVKHTRTQEESADKLALEYLRKANSSPKGLMSLLQYFKQQSAGYDDLIDEYALTHPISQKRINYIKSNLSSFSESQKTSDEVLTKMKYVRAKIQAFLGDSDKILKYFNSDSPFDKYGRSVAYFKKGDLKNSIIQIDDLIKMDANNGYFHELKGQILFENGLIKNSIISYKRAVELLKNPSLAKVSLSTAILALKSEDSDLVNFAISNLNQAKIKERTNGQVFSQLAIAHLKINEKGRSYLALSELNILRNDNKKARKYAKLAIEELPKGDKSGILKAKDILATIKDDGKES